METEWRLIPFSGWQMQLVIYQLNMMLWTFSEIWFGIECASTKVTLHRLTCALSAADMCIASAISLLMILICGMATYGAYKVNQWFIRFTRTMLLIKTKRTTDCVSQISYFHNINGFQTDIKYINVARQLPVYESHNKSLLYYNCKHTVISLRTSTSSDLCSQLVSLLSDEYISLS